MLQKVTLTLLVGDNKCEHRIIFSPKLIENYRYEQTPCISLKKVDK